MKTHVDLSRKYNQKGDSFVGCVDDDSKPLFAVVLKQSIIEELEKKYNVKQDYTILHAIVISILLDKMNLNPSEIVVCNDCNPLENVFRHLNGMLKECPTLIHIGQWKEEIKNSNAKSKAHNFVNKLATKFPKVRNVHRFSKVFDCGYYIIKKKEIEELVKKYYVE